MVSSKVKWTTNYKLLWNSVADTSWRALLVLIHLQPSSVPFSFGRLMGTKVSKPPQPNWRTLCTGRKGGISNSVWLNVCSLAHTSVLYHAEIKLKWLEETPHHALSATFNPKLLKHVIADRWSVIREQILSTGTCLWSWRTKLCSVLYGKHNINNLWRWKNGYSLSTRTIHSSINPL